MIDAFGKMIILSVDEKLELLNQLEKKDNFGFNDKDYILLNRCGIGTIQMVKVFPSEIYIGEDLIKESLKLNIGAQIYFNGSDDLYDYFNVIRKDKLKEFLSISDKRFEELSEKKEIKLMNFSVEFDTFSKVDLVKILAHANIISMDANRLNICLYVYYS